MQLSTYQILSSLTFCQIWHFVTSDILSSLTFCQIWHFVISDILSYLTFCHIWHFVTSDIRKILESDILFKDTLWLNYQKLTFRVITIHLIWHLKCTLKSRKICSMEPFNIQKSYKYRGFESESNFESNKRNTESSSLAMYTAQRKPHLFLTVCCDTTWNEISNCLKDQIPVRKVCAPSIMIFIKHYC